MCVLGALHLAFGGEAQCKLTRTRRLKLPLPRKYWICQLRQVADFELFFGCLQTGPAELAFQGMVAV